MTRFVPEETSSMIGMPLPFTNGEYSRRIDAVRKRLVEEKLDALLIFHQESMFYLFGYEQTGYWIYQTAILTADNPEITVFVRTADEHMVRGLPYVGDVRTWKDDSANDPIAITVDLLRERGVLGNGKRIGIELKTHALLPFYHKRLNEALPSLVDASDLITELRIRKSDAEVVCMREAGKVLDAAYAGAFDALRPGVLETEVLAAALTGMFRAGGHVPAIVPPFASGPRLLSWTHGHAVDRRILPNEAVTIEPGGSRHRYHAVGVQTRWVGGEPTAKVQQTFDELIQAQEAAVSMIRPGVSTADAAREINRVLKQFELYKPGAHSGYGTGIGYPPTWLDTLRIMESDRHVFERNMTFFLVSYWAVKEVGDVTTELCLGEPFIVTDTGCERLSATPLSLT
ncbi:Xaa-Pro peptidase family protein [Mesorhizobium sp.]|uniref:M24 family metallopeptidase n=1 Tax=Mesorhizobium sp. TaxID=1871066 RepID=UPI000FE9A431|nr:Xaa-Pro peptidase family protein [Mesorhizobium sp.]TGQ62608.1 aminopeptidase P family protein [bacterium M00.F.Ca.ET.205.01.1.1]TGU45269.1 aminopeptidase P family protein [bacterium M00.F.Ca.ET.152.01.1.1]TGV31090.1 aminopeptidase P family protein [Mesorhizobium sp. M00.F.Ca.ET.186.01.1.1]TGZ38640.1 aminopeptidase P family protein [bacterium M00.F.Ca.ET.162.01.1.1]RWA58412.1 MAG: aminopeptidase P family protein [Mesorhizobium sp.]